MKAFPSIFEESFTTLYDRQIRLYVEECHVKTKHLARKERYRTKQILFSYLSLMSNVNNSVYSFSYKKEPKFMFGSSYNGHLLTF